MYDSDYATVEYIEKDNIVLLVWKKEAHFDNYRKPTTYALDLLRQHKDSQFIVDARNGFEDTKEDTLWGTTYLLPEIGKTTCKYICFILNNSRTDIQDEMDMWTIEFGKYLAVTKAENYEEALKSFSCNLWADVKYKVKVGKRDEFINELIEHKMIEKSRQEPGNVKYEVLMPIDSKDGIILSEIWTNKMEQQRHSMTAHYAVLGELKKKYVEDVSIVTYHLTNGR